ncbi:phage tail fibers [Photobacterium aphoticum]|uniref:Phage tail fibers n=1 Tax=Photobacterium aphoticum TaxID=754436 RepID=A0A090QXQ2_9GAMM|nr:phage tail fibers [Photobacterium aphoticum]
MRTIQSEFEDYKTRASLPVGAIVLFPKLPVPADFLPCDGRKFDKTLFADLYNYLGTDTTPVYTAKYVKMISDTLSPLQTVPWQIPDHSHSVDVSHTHTATFRGNPLPNHYHQTGNPWSNLHSYNVSRFGKDVTGNGSVATETQNSLLDRIHEQKTNPQVHHQARCP